MFAELIPMIAAGGALVTVSGLLWRQPLRGQLAAGASIALAALPEGLPLLSGVGEAAVARRLSARGALARRLAAVEAMGRVDVACVDKTGTLTEGKPALSCVIDAEGRSATPPDLKDEAASSPSSSPAHRGLKHVLEAAVLASPHPDAPDWASHPTDVAVIRGAVQAGLDRVAATERDEEERFEPSRGFHATRVGAHIFIKGATEVLAPRCDRVERRGREGPLAAAEREELMRRAESLSSAGLRVLMVAEAIGHGPLDDPTGLVALGFVGISDTLRADVAAVVARCEAAGVRVVMLTGDHPATAVATAREAGLATDGSEPLSGPELQTLDAEELDRRLESTRVIARITPLDKMRIVEALQRRGHVVAMTGDGVNDAPALRLADVGVAMGRGGTEVARSAADVVLANDDFATLVETLREGRGFWRRIRRALGLLLGGNLGELLLMACAGVAGGTPPLSARQVLAVNLVTDVLPAVAVAVQRPEDTDLAQLAREGTAALGAPLRRDIVRRGLATGLPSFAAYALARGAGDQDQARMVAFAAVVTSQLAQTLDVGRTDGHASPEVIRAVAGSAAFLLCSVVFAPLRRFLRLSLPTPLGLLLSAAATLGSLATSRAL